MSFKLNTFITQTFKIKQLKKPLHLVRVLNIELNFCMATNYSVSPESAVSSTSEFIIPPKSNQSPPPDILPSTNENAW